MPSIPLTSRGSSLTLTYMSKYGIEANEGGSMGMAIIFWWNEKVRLCHIIQPLVVVSRENTALKCFFPGQLQGTQIQHPSLSGGGIRMRRSRAYTQAMWRLLHQGNCTHHSLAMKRESPRRFYLGFSKSMSKGRTLSAILTHRPQHGSSFPRSRWGRRDPQGFSRGRW